MLTVSREIKLSEGTTIGGGKSLFLIAGPCVLESEEHALFLARQIKQICRQFNLPFIFKASFDKANRSSLKSYRGPGIEKGLAILKTVKEEVNLPVLSDIHEPWQAEPAAEVLDVLQIPAFLCRQTDLLLAAARTFKPINLKKGQFMAPEDMALVIEKVTSQGNEQIMLTERGTSFGYHDLIVDPRSIAIMKQWGYPVIIDASHSVQKPGGAGIRSSGRPEFIPVIAKAAIAAGADGLFLEVHEEPSRALSDKDNSLKLDQLKEVLKSVLAIWSSTREINHEEK
ncbi:MAG: 3-deoxy-8-phosphooctulonate synthase [Candidatus Aminicenantes bacterium]|nr:3-deoxy-8-phosphooctulonate synthase [Candidatus Aminicenantes bacterium]